MNIQVEQPCPQCDGSVTLSVEDRLLACPFCGVKSFLQISGAFRYALPNKVIAEKQDQLLYAPYLRFKGNIFTVSESGISYKVLDTTQDGCLQPGLPPSLGLRPQAMKLVRIHNETRGRFLPLAVNIQKVLEKAARIQSLSRKGDESLHHRAYIGETLSYIYLPLLPREDGLFDAVLGESLPHADASTVQALASTPFQPNWQMKFLATLCPRCGWNLDGEGDCLVLICSSCDTAWRIDKKGLSHIACTMFPGPSDTALYLPFWRLSVNLPAVEIQSFADFIRRTNQPLVPRKEWEKQAMQFWIPAFKLRPKIFLRTAKQATVSQWRLTGEQQEKEMRIVPNMYPVTLPLSEAKQSLKLVLADSATNKRKVFPHLPYLQPEFISSSLVFLPFKDCHHDWVQTPGGTVIAKSVLHFGRAL
ncbi:Replication restart DNA helicase PriA [Candidatus Electrothrix laxa]